MKKVLIPTKLDKIAADILRSHGGYVVVQDDSVSTSEEALLAFVRSHPDAYALIVRSERVTPAVIDAIPSLKVIVRAGAGSTRLTRGMRGARGLT